MPKRSWWDDVSRWETIFRIVEQRQLTKTDTNGWAEVWRVLEGVPWDFTAVDGKGARKNAAGNWNKHHSFFYKNPVHPLERKRYGGTSRSDKILSVVDMVEKTVLLSDATEATYGVRAAYVPRVSTSSDLEGGGELDHEWDAYMMAVRGLKDLALKQPDGPEAQVVQLMVDEGCLVADNTAFTNTYGTLFEGLSPNMCLIDVFLEMGGVTLSGKREKYPTGEQFLAEYNDMLQEDAEAAANSQYAQRVAQYQKKIFETIKQAVEDDPNVMRRLERLWATKPYREEVLRRYHERNERCGCKYCKGTIFDNPLFYELDHDTEEAQTVKRSGLLTNGRKKDPSQSTKAELKALRRLLKIRCGYDHKLKTNPSYQRHKCSRRIQKQHALLNHLMMSISGGRCFFTGEEIVEYAAYDMHHPLESKDLYNTISSKRIDMSKRTCISQLASQCGSLALFKERVFREAPLLVPVNRMVHRFIHWVLSNFDAVKAIIPDIEYPFTTNKEEGLLIPTDASFFADEEDEIPQENDTEAAVSGVSFDAVELIAPAPDANEEAIAEALTQALATLASDKEPEAAQLAMATRLTLSASQMKRLKAADRLNQLPPSRVDATSDDGSVGIGLDIKSDKSLAVNDGKGTKRKNEDGNDLAHLTTSPEDTPPPAKKSRCSETGGVALSNNMGAAGGGGNHSPLTNATLNGNTAKAYPKLPAPQKPTTFTGKHLDQFSRAVGLVCAAEGGWPGESGWVKVSNTIGWNWDAAKCETAFYDFHNNPVVVSMKKKMGIYQG